MESNQGRTDKNGSSLFQFLGFKIFRQFVLFWVHDAKLFVIKMVNYKVLPQIVLEKFWQVWSTHDRQCGRFWVLSLHKSVAGVTLPNNL